ncbi:actinodefensin-associated protein B [Streptomyces sp. AS02]|uniref:actinodefensin-associated protein B n=1 Tax=Streptomyces sp. AS02 TaxID=2938946 RepID=UPI0020216959|nr:actinodefensin-associated protein B [Streptomyces sp. AS02]MCL8015965.1 actinodefensin-associated protein B [Streptomyces sp. AS02]
MLTTQGYVRLADHVVFRELPFCGVLLDRRRCEVYRLSQRAAAALRMALEGGHAQSPYASLLGAPEPEHHGALQRKLVQGLQQRGMLTRISLGRGADEHSPAEEDPDDG